MSKSFKKQKRQPSDHRNQVAREMIIERVGVNAGPMKHGKDKRAKNPKRDWRGEDYYSE